MLNHKKECFECNDFYEPFVKKAPAHPLANDKMEVTFFVPIGSRKRGAWLQVLHYIFCETETIFDYAPPDGYGE